MTSADVKNRSLTGADVKPGSLSECPSGMRLFGGLCFETSARPALDYGLALFDCAGEGRHLPTQGELAAYDSFTYTGSQSTPREWVEPSWTDSGSERANYVAALSNGGLGFGSDAVNAQYAYRCVVGPSS